MSEITRIFTLVILGGLVIALLSCDVRDEWLEDTLVQEVSASDTTTIGSNVLVVYSLPAGCNHLHRVETELESDTIFCRVVLLHYTYSDGRACAHGPLTDTVQFVIDPGRTGDFVLCYQDSDSTRLCREIRIVSGQ